MSEGKKEQIGISVDQLRDLLIEIKKPVVTEADLRKEAGRKQMAQEELASMRARDEAKEQRQRNCTHSHRDGQTRTVRVQPGTGGVYRLCQFCQKIIRPEVEHALFIHHEQHSPADVF